MSIFNIIFFIAIVLPIYIFREGYKMFKTTMSEKNWWWRIPPILVVILSVLVVILLLSGYKF